MKRYPRIQTILLIILTLWGCSACTANTPAKDPTNTISIASAPTRTPQPTMVLPAVSADISSQPEPTIADLPSETAAPASTGQTIAGAGFTFISETIPDGSHFDPGEVFHKTWTIRNSGSTAWKSDYALTQTGVSSQGADLNSPVSIPLGAEVPPGSMVEIGADLTAPQQDGTYSVYFQLTDGNGGIIPNSQMWVSITVGDVVASTGNSSFSAKNITAELVESTNQNGTFEVTYCMEMPDTRYWYAWEATLTVNGDTYSPMGGSYDPHGLDTPTRCFSIGYPLTVAAGTPYQISIPKVEIDPVQFQAENCARAQNQLFAAYPGMNFTCTSPGFFYSILSLPAGMSEAQAGQLIMDALSNTIYGPWVLAGVAN